MIIDRLFYVLIIASVVFSVKSAYGGPARSFASVVAARAIKIPRSIRAPFRNNEMMTARGFGKRSQQLIKMKNSNVMFYVSERKFLRLNNFRNSTKSLLHPYFKIPKMCETGK